MPPPAVGAVVVEELERPLAWCREGSSFELSRPPRPLQCRHPSVAAAKALQQPFLALFPGRSQPSFPERRPRCY